MKPLLMLNKYYIYDENGELMRIVKSRQEAKQICSIRQGWTFKVVKKSKVNLYELVGECLI